MIGRTKDFSWFSIFLGSMAVYILHSLLMLHIDSVNQTVFFFFFFSVFTDYSIWSKTVPGPAQGSPITLS